MHGKHFIYSCTIVVVAALNITKAVSSTLAPESMSTRPSSYYYYKNTKRKLYLASTTDSSSADLGSAEAQPSECTSIVSIAICITYSSVPGVPIVSIRVRYQLMVLWQWQILSFAAPVAPVSREEHILAHMGGLDTVHVQVNVSTIFDARATCGRVTIIMRTIVNFIGKLMRSREMLIITQPITKCVTNEVRIF